jgi:hypothetical protein
MVPSRVLLTLTALTLTACAADSTDASWDDPSGAVELQATRLAYFTWDYAQTTGTWVKDPNGGYTVCANGCKSNRCRVEQIVYPADCNWECSDEGIGPNTQGYDLLHGTLAYKTIGGKRKAVLTIKAAWDTMSADAPRGYLYRIRPRAMTCTQAPCPGPMFAWRVNRGTTGRIAFNQIDFATAQDPNYHSQPGRGWNEVLTAEGLYATGSDVGGTFVVDQVFRRWTPQLGCNPYTTALGYWQVAGGDYQTDFRTEVEAMNYVVPEDFDDFKWLVRDQDAWSTTRFTGGLRDQWAVRFTVDKKSCAVTLVGEH